jgi:hypothetical protein
LIELGILGDAVGALMCDSVDSMQYDVSAKFRINERVQLFAELINLCDEPYLGFQRGSVGDRLLQYEEYSWTGKIGIKASF